MQRNAIKITCHIFLLRKPLPHCSRQLVVRRILEAGNNRRNLAAISRHLRFAVIRPFLIQKAIQGPRQSIF